MKTATQEHIYTVTELNRQIRLVLDDAFPKVWVEGEISNLTKHTSGHMYFSIKDEGSVISCVLFKYQNLKLKFNAENGQKVLCYGRVGVYDKRGQYQLYVDKMEPKGLGALQLAFEQLKERLRIEGLFDASHKREIPYLPHRIGVITSPTGAAIRDILKVTRERFQNVDVIINPTRVQGKGAELEIAQAIEDLNEYKEVDVIIVGRGGGSLEDLWAFNEEVVARAIYNSEIPIISAVGHEVDITIADFTADLRAATPSAAAELVIPKKEDLIQRIESARLRLKGALTGMVEAWEANLDRLQESRIFKQPFTIIEQLAQETDDLAKGATLRMGHILKMREGLFKNLAGKLESLSPFAVLERGYSITARIPSGDAVKDARSLKKGDRVKTRLRRGSFVCSVERIEETHKDDRA
ncbi:MAG: exodeoxyribonuclease VII large subunit [Candidatus Omnitrophota bacterium]